MEVKINQIVITEGNCCDSPFKVVPKSINISPKKRSMGLLRGGGGGGRGVSKAKRLKGKYEAKSEFQNR